MFKIKQSNDNVSMLKSLKIIYINIYINKFVCF